MMSRPGLVAIVAAAGTMVATVLGGCSSASAGDSPPVVVCGTTLKAGGGAMPVLWPARRWPHVLHSSDWLYVQVAEGCAHGSSVTWVPRSAARIGRAAYASDGLAAAVVLQPTRPYTTYRLVAKSGGRVVASYTVDPAS